LYQKLYYDSTDLQLLIKLRLKLNTDRLTGLPIFA